MSMHFVVVSIQGNHLTEMGDVFEKCGYAVENPKTVQTAKQASSEMAKSGGKAAYFANGWTFIVDPELLLMSNDAWLHYSKKWKARIVGWLCEGTSASYGLTLYENEIVSVDGNVVVDKGKPLPEESKVDWSVGDGEEAILQIAERLGAKYVFPAKAEYRIFKLSAPEA